MSYGERILVLEQGTHISRQYETGNFLIQNALYTVLGSDQAFVLRCSPISDWESFFAPATTLIESFFPFLPLAVL